MNRRVTQSYFLEGPFWFLFKIETVSIIQAIDDGSMNSSRNIEDSAMGAFGSWMVFECRNNRCEM